MNKPSDPSHGEQPVAWPQSIIDLGVEVMVRVLEQPVPESAPHYQEAVVRAILDACATPQQSGWRSDMESAPKDGRHVLLWDADEFVAEGYYEQDGDRGWYAANTHWTDYCDGSLYPTHWQPFPEGPSK